MCAIIGSIGKELDRNKLCQLRDFMKHRGPDDFGDWLDHDEKVWFGHRRLSIIDTSTAGHQPFISSDKRYVLVFNGEIYNFIDIKNQLIKHGYKFRSHSDTEVLLYAIDKWSVELAVQKFIGMFAFSLWDNKEKKLWLVRDRMGVKPLYYSFKDENFAFASEIKPLSKLSWIDDAIDMDALSYYFKNLYFPAKRSIYKSIHKLQPGSILCWEKGNIEIKSYWDLKNIKDKSAKLRKLNSSRDYSNEFKELIHSSIKMRMVSDVPIGVFLSGGIDSSLVASIMQEESMKKIKSFSIGFEIQKFDESVHAKKVAEYLNLDHHEEIFHPKQLVELMPRIASMQDEPFADSSIVPTYLLSNFARKHVKVSLSGDGGDELFAGYPKYFWVNRISLLKKTLGKRMTHQLASVIKVIPDYVWNDLVDKMTLGRFSSVNGFSHRVNRFADYLSVDSKDVFKKIIIAWKEPSELINFNSYEKLGQDDFVFSDENWAEAFMECDQKNYLVDDIMKKVDIASMRASLEAREPLLDHRLVEWGWSLPLNQKVGRKLDKGKMIMRNNLYNYVPEHLIDRPKQGFTMPIGLWLRKDLKKWAQEILFDNSSIILNKSIIKKKWEEHLSGQDRTHELWTVIMYLVWEKNKHNSIN